MKSIELHILAPCADLETVATVGDSVSDYQRTETDDGRPCLTEWGPEQRQFLSDRCQLVPAVHSIHWHMTTLSSYERILDGLVDRQQTLLQLQSGPQSALRRIVVMSLADGGETDGWPGVSVIRGLENRPSLPFTGAGSEFFQLDTVKNRIKSHMAAAGASSRLTPAYVETSADRLLDGSALEELRTLLRMPVIVKPSLSSGSRGITADSVVNTPLEAFRIAQQLNEEFGGSYVEEFIAGPEFTCLVMGDGRTDDGYADCQTFAAAQRCFRSTLPSTQQFLYFDMKWKEWGQDQAAGKSWWYAVAPAEYQQQIQQTAKEVYRAVGGNGYARMDLRMDQRTGQLFVIDVNANCSLDGDDESALGIILRGEGCGLSTVIERMLCDALVKQANQQFVAESPRYVAAAGATTSTLSVTSEGGDSAADADDAAVQSAPARRMTAVSAC
jgi:D-alanine-D-alanine ligase